MRTQDQYEITAFEMTISVISLIFGVGILFQPSSLANALETPDGWMSLIVTGVISMGLVSIYSRLQKSFPGKSLFQYIESGITAKIGVTFVGAAFIIYFILVMAFQGRIFAVAIQMFLLYKTPTEVIVAVLLLMITYAETKGLQGIVHLNLLFTPIILVVLTVVLFSSVGLGDLDVNLPIMREGFTPILLGIMPSFYTLIGFLLIFFFMGKMKASTIKATPINIALAVVVLIQAFFVIFVQSTLGFESTKTLVFPAIGLVKEIEIPGQFFERTESLFLTIWVISVFTSMAMNLWMTLYLLRSYYFKRKRSRWLTPAVIFITYIVTFLPVTVEDTFQLGEWSGIVGVVAVSLAFIFAFITYRGARHHNRGA
ncbi:GerAB/ArcD/ProY family transporter [Desertibacillus haloalkaliphilus]|uniref:GerAB/ArcD/ProY family transporter n=1 Tax=Desertibacillus haloalkaliphilus TaxID=1328930 RepID=UPI001C26C37D|nr:GerAB/ArcD/ProY family transporter [Desertibacillus haloalkaliphilus]MBU8908667.1 spore germination protein [Desertibacillus haloalkaliphilus]